MECGTNEMMCPGGMDTEGCPLPDMCMPMMYGAEEMLCPGGMDPQGCPMPGMCMPSTGPMDSNGVECPVVCPTVCAPGDMMCPGGMTETGCIIADTCQAEGTECPLPPMPM